MNIRIDTHTHSVASGHAYSTIDDLARGARRRRLAGFVLTEHGPSLPGGAHPYHFNNLKVIPRKISGVHFFCGAETNIMDMDGTIDLSPAYTSKLDFVMAGLHEFCFPPRSREENTRAMVAAIANPQVDAISHPGNAAFPVDLDAVVQAALRYGKALEINNATFRVRPGSVENCRYIARRCAELGVLLTCASDAHYWTDVGNVTQALDILRQAGARKEQVINSSMERFREFSEERRRIRSGNGPV